MKWFRKLTPSLLQFSSITVFVFILFLFAIPKNHVFAQAQNWRFSSFGAEFDAADAGEVNAGAYVDRTSSASIISLACQISPMIGFCTEDATKLGLLQQKSALGSIAKVITSTFSVPPANTYAFFQDMGQTLGFLPKQTYAQGVGFSGLSPLLPLWKAFRNIAYAFLAVVMIVVGFMVMLRKKIDPKTVITIQNALPRIVITLLLITFSYAIVGIMIDLMYLVILFLLSLITNASANYLPEPSTVNQLLGNTTNQMLYTQGSLLMNLQNIRVSPWQIVFGWNIVGAIPELLATLGAGVLGGAMAVAGIVFAGPTGGASLLATLGGGILGMGMPIVYLLINLAMLFLFIKLFILFVGAYIQIVLSLIISPLQILGEAIPGSTAFSSWLKNLFANIIVFPIGAAFFMLSNIFSGFAANNSKMWTPPYVGILNNSASIQALISIGILFAIPTVAGQVKEALKTKSPVDAGPGAILGPLGSGGGQLLQLAYQLKFIAAPGGHGGGMADTTAPGRVVKGAKDGLTG